MTRLVIWLDRLAHRFKARLARQRMMRLFRLTCRVTRPLCRWAEDMEYRHG